MSGNFIFRFLWSAWGGRILCMNSLLFQLRNTWAISPVNDSTFFADFTDFGRQGITCFRAWIMDRQLITRLIILLVKGSTLFRKWRQKWFLIIVKTFDQETVFPLEIFATCQRMLKYLIFVFSWFSSPEIHYIIPRDRHFSPVELPGNHWSTSVIPGEGGQILHWPVQNCFFNCFMSFVRRGKKKEEQNSTFSFWRGNLKEKL